MSPLLDSYCPMEYTMPVFANRILLQTLDYKVEKIIYIYIYILPLGCRRQPKAQGLEPMFRDEDLGIGFSKVVP